MCMPLITSESEKPLSIYIHMLTGLQILPEFEGRTNFMSTRWWWAAPVG